MKSVKFLVIGISSTVLGLSQLNCGRQINGESRYSQELDACMPCKYTPLTPGPLDCVKCGNFVNGTTRLTHDVDTDSYSCSDCELTDNYGYDNYDHDHNYPWSSDQWPTYAEEYFLDCKLQPLCYEEHDENPNGNSRVLGEGSFNPRLRGQCTPCALNFYSTSSGTNSAGLYCHNQKVCGLQNDGSERLISADRQNPGYCAQCSTGFYAPAGHYDCQSINTLVQKGFLPFDPAHGDDDTNHFGQGNAIKDCDNIFGKDRGYNFAPKDWTRSSLSHILTRFLDRSELHDVARHIWQCKRSNLDILIRELKVARQSNKAAREKYSESLYLTPEKTPRTNAPINKNVLQYLQQLDPEFVENNYIGDEVSR